MHAGVRSPAFVKVPNLCVCARACVNSYISEHKDCLYQYLARETCVLYNSLARSVHEFTWKLESNGFIQCFPFR